MLPRGRAVVKAKIGRTVTNRIGRNIRQHETRPSLLYDAVAAAPGVP
jgi:hypothetical protein